MSSQSFGSKPGSSPATQILDRVQKKSGRGARSVGSSDRSAYPKAEHILVIGAGVVGLTTALLLLREGFKVSVLSDQFSPRLTSNVAGALWEWPPAVCGHHRDPISLDRSKAWCMVSYERFEHLAQIPETGVKLLSSVFFFRHLVEEREGDLAKMREIETRLQGFRHDSKLIEENGVNPQIGLKDGYQHLAPVIHTDIYLTWLTTQISRLGGVLIHRKLCGRLIEQADRLRQEFGAAAIVNCAGLGSRELADDPMYPLRGALIRVHNDGRYFPPVTKALSITLDEQAHSQNMIYLVPRGDVLLLGGLVEKGEESTEIGLENYPLLQDMYDRCIDFLPMLKRAKLDEGEPVRVGLRPGRPNNVRLEEEPEIPIVHNYGHGGSGVTLSWGCGVETVERVKAMVLR